MTNNILHKEIRQADLESAIVHVTQIVKENGFGVLYTIDFGEISRKKGKTDLDEYVQLWICNPEIWFWLLSLDKNYGTLLPCPICIYKEWSQYHVTMVKPSALLALHLHPEAQHITQQADDLVKEVFEKL